MTDPRIRKLATYLASQHNLQTWIPRLSVRPKLVRLSKLDGGARWLGRSHSWAIAGEYANVPRARLIIDDETREKMRDPNRVVIEGDADVRAVDACEYGPRFSDLTEAEYIALCAAIWEPKRAADFMDEAKRQIDLRDRRICEEWQNARRQLPAVETFRGAPA